PAIGAPSVSFATPFTVAIWANEGTTLSIVNSNNALNDNFVFIVSPAKYCRGSEAASIKLLKLQPHRVWDLWRPLQQRRAVAKRNFRTRHRRGLRGCNKTTLNRRVRPLQGQVLRSPLFALRSAGSRFRCCPPSCPP